MKAMHIQDDIVPIGEFKTHASRILRGLRGNGRPVVITQHGKPVGVLVSPADFDRLAAQARFVAAVNEGLADSEAGRVVSDAELAAELDRKFGPPETP